jgi:ATP-dependent Clp protease ATP-binding subunit ClpX
LTEPKNAPAEAIPEDTHGGGGIEVRPEGCRQWPPRLGAKDRRAVCALAEQALLDTMFDLPSLNNVRKAVIDEGTITGDIKPLLIYSDQPKVAGSAQ